MTANRTFVATGFAAVALPLLVSAACSSSSKPATTSGPTDASVTSDVTTSMPDVSTTVDADAGADAAPTPDEIAAFKQLVTDATSMIADAHAPGASIAVVLRGKVAFAQGIGVSNTTSQEPVTNATIFSVGALSEMVAAATALKLGDQGMLDVTQPITKYVPWFLLESGFDATKLTTDSLLTHTSGFPGDTIAQCSSNASGSRYAFFTTYPQPLWSPPGAVFNVANSEYSLVGSILEGAAGVAEGQFDTVVHDQIFAPVGMTNAIYDLAGIPPDHATGYEVDGSGNVVNTYQPNTIACPMSEPSGGVQASASDYAHFAEMLLANGGDVLKASSVAALEAAPIDVRALPTRTYGYGLYRQFSPYATHASYWRDGSIPGYASLFWMIPDSGFAVVVLVNANGPTPATTNIVGDALQLFVSTNEAVPPLTTDAAAWPAYTGTYDDDFATLGKSVAITLVPNTTDGGAPTLTISAPNSTDFAGNVFPLHGAMIQAQTDTWTLPDGTSATFFPDDAGVSRYLATRRGTAVRAP